MCAPQRHWGERCRRTARPELAPYSVDTSVVDCSYFPGAASTRRTSWIRCLTVRIRPLRDRKQVRGRMCSLLRARSGRVNTCLHMHLIPVHAACVRACTCTNAPSHLASAIFVSSTETPKEKLHNPGAYFFAVNFLPRQSSSPRRYFLVARPGREWVISQRRREKIQPLGPQHST